MKIYDEPDDLSDFPEQDLLSRVRSMFEEARQTLDHARAQSEIDYDYFHGIQWSASEQAELRRRRQPVVTFNLVRSKVESLCGVEENTQTSPKAWPRTPADENAAKVATDTLRYVTDINRFDKTRVDVLRDMLIGGTGAALIEVTPKGEEQRPEITIRRLRWESFLYDPYSRECDFSDARYLGVAQWMDEADILSLYGAEAQEAVEGAIFDAGLGAAASREDIEDRPNWGWGDARRRRALVVELFHKESGIWHHTVFTGSGIIRSGISVYRDGDNQPACPIEAVSAYVNRENERYGVVRDMRSPQDEINHRRSKLLHLLNTRQTFRKEGAIATRDPQALRRELNRPDGDVVIAKNAVWGQDVGIIDTHSMSEGQAQLLEEAKGFLDRLGPNSALLGRDNDISQSGRAILAQQQAGLAELATLFAAHNDWVLRIYRQIWARARQFWTAPMFIRVTDDFQSPQFIQINEPILDEMNQPVLNPQTGQPFMRNRIAEMGVDLVVDRSPLAMNLQIEEFRTLAELAAAGIAIPPNVLIMASTLRNKQALLEALNPPQLPPPPPPAPDPVMQQLAAAETAKLQAEAAERMARAEKITLEARKGLMG